MYEIPMNQLKRGLKIIRDLYGINSEIVYHKHPGKEPEVILWESGGKQKRIKFYPTHDRKKIIGSSASKLIKNLSKEISEITNVSDEEIKFFLKSPHPKKELSQQSSRLEQMAVSTSVLAITLSLFFVVFKQEITGAFAGTLQKSLIIIPLILIVIAALLIILNLIKQRKS